MASYWAQFPLDNSRGAQGIIQQAAQLETDQWDGILLFDSQSLVPDPYVTLAIAAAGTSTLGLGIGVTNPVTRHAAITASAIASVQEASNGRAVLGIGRGNSSLAYLGAAPAKLKDFANYVHQVQTYLKGGKLDLSSVNPYGDGIGSSSGLDEITIGHAPEASGLNWLNPGIPKAPVEVAATGPKVISLAVEYGDRISFSVGANLDRLKWAIETARNAALAQGKDAEALKMTAYVSVVAHEDLETACYFSAPDVAMHAHIAGLNKSVSVPATKQDKAVFEKVAQNYDMTRHARRGAQTDALPQEFIVENAVVGPADGCVEKIKEITALGIDRVAFMTPPPRAPKTREIYETLVTSVLAPLKSS